MVQSKILIVDDDPNVCLVLERTLRQDHYELNTAHNGLEALEKLRKDSYDLLLLDLNMQPMNGMQVLNAIRQANAEKLRGGMHLEAETEMVVIILTAFSTIESAVEALRLGAFDYLFKPASPEAIRERVREGIQHQQKILRRQRLLKRIEQLRTTIQELEAESDAIAEVEAPERLDANRFLKVGRLSIDRHHRKVMLDDRLLDLTTTEFNLLNCLASASPEPVSPRQLVNQALNYDSQQSEAREIIKGHIFHLRHKIEPDPKHPIYIKTVHYKGYLWSG